MTNPYRELFSGSGTIAFSVSGLVARTPLPMIGIGIITMLSQLRGSYALAGAVSATFVLTYALLSPQVSRMVDQHGQSRVLPIAASISAFGMSILVASTWWGGARLGIVRWCFSNGLHAEHVCHGKGSLDDNLSRATLLADSLLTGNSF
jgi:MFS family permease